jgi:hypothetical protein
MFQAAGFDSVEIRGFLTPYDTRGLGPLASRLRQDWFLGITAA